MTTAAAPSSASEVLGRLNLLVDRGLVRELTEADAAVWEAVEP